MKRKQKLALVAAAVATCAAPAVASAHWVGRTMPASGGWWAIHTGMTLSSGGSDCTTQGGQIVCGSVEVFASYGGSSAVPYGISIMGENTGTVYCNDKLPWPRTVFGQHYIVTCPNFPITIDQAGKRYRYFPEPVRCRVAVPSLYGPAYPTVGYYCRERNAPA